MTNLSNIITDNNVLTDNNTQTVTNKTITSTNDIDASAITSGTVGTARLASGTADSTTYLRGDQTWDTISAGLTYFADAESTASPNDTDYVDSLTVQGSSTNVDIALVAKGTGATLSSIPDNLTAGGNKRGDYAIDWQKSRGGNFQVAGGNYSVISGGARNAIGTGSSYSTVSGGYQNYSYLTTGDNNAIGGGYFNEITSGSASSIVGGYGQDVAGSYTVSGGYLNDANANYAVVFGSSNLASGSWSFCVGQNGSATGSASFSMGDNNDATGSYSVSLGRSGTASGDYSFTMGNANTASGLGGGAIGYNNTSSGNYSFCAGSSNEASGNISVALGAVNDATDSYSFAAGYSTLSDGVASATFGQYTDAKQRHNTIALGCPAVGSSTTNAATSATQILAANTTDATTTLLYSGSTSSDLYKVRMDTNSAYAFRVLVVANVTGGGDTKAWELLGCIKQGASASTIALVGSVTKTVIAADTGASSWDCDINVNTVNGTFTVEATGAASTNIRWGATVYTTEVDY